MRPSTAIISFFLALALSGGTSFGQTSVVNAASFDSTSPMAPGSFATVFGQNLCGQTATGQLDSGGRYPITLGGCSLTVNGAAAMMQYVASGQMNFVVPQNMGAGTASVVINNGAQMSTSSMPIGLAGPGVFSTDGMGMGNGAMLLSTTWQMGPFSPTTNGQPTPVSIFVTGMISP